MSGNTAGLAGIIVGGLTASALVVGGVTFALFVRRPEVGPGIEPAAIALGLCLTPVLVAVGAWGGSAAFRRVARAVCGPRTGTRAVTRVPHPGSP